MSKKLILGSIITVVLSMLGLSKLYSSQEAKIFLPVWQECRSQMIEFYEKKYTNYKNVEINFHEFPQSDIQHKRLIGVLELVGDDKLIVPLYPSINCLLDSEISSSYDEPQTLPIIENFIGIIKSDQSPNFGYMVFEKDKYTIRYSKN